MAELTPKADTTEITVIKKMMVITMMMTIITAITIITITAAE